MSGDTDEEAGYVEGGMRGEEESSSRKEGRRVSKEGSSGRGSGKPPPNNSNLMETYCMLFLYDKIIRTVDSRVHFTPSIFLIEFVLHLFYPVLLPIIVCVAGAAYATNRDYWGLTQPWFWIQLVMILGVYVSNILYFLGHLDEVSLGFEVAMMNLLFLLQRAAVAIRYAFLTELERTEFLQHVIPLEERRRKFLVWGFMKPDELLMFVEMERAIARRSVQVDGVVEEASKTAAEQLLDRLGKSLDLYLKFEGLEREDVLVDVGEGAESEQRGIPMKLIVWHILYNSTQHSSGSVMMFITSFQLAVAAAAVAITAISHGSLLWEATVPSIPGLVGLLLILVILPCLFHTNVGYIVAGVAAYHRTYCALRDLGNLVDTDQLAATLQHDVPLDFGFDPDPALPQPETHDKSIPRRSHHRSPFPSSHSRGEIISVASLQHFSADLFASRATIGSHAPRHSDGRKEEEGIRRRVGKSQVLPSSSAAADRARPPRRMGTSDTSEDEAEALFSPSSSYELGAKAALQMFEEHKTRAREGSGRIKGARSAWPRPRIDRKHLPTTIATTTKTRRPSTDLKTSRRSVELRTSRRSVDVKTGSLTKSTPDLVYPGPHSDRPPRSPPAVAHSMSPPPIVALPPVVATRAAGDGLEFSRNGGADPGAGPGAGSGSRARTSAQTTTSTAADVAMDKTRALTSGSLSGDSDDDLDADETTIAPIASLIDPDQPQTSHMMVVPISRDGSDHDAGRSDTDHGSARARSIAAEKETVAMLPIDSVRSLLNNSAYFLACPPGSMFEAAMTKDTLGSAATPRGQAKDSGTQRHRLTRVATSEEIRRRIPSHALLLPLDTASPVEALSREANADGTPSPRSPGDLKGTSFVMQIEDMAEALGGGDEHSHESAASTKPTPKTGKPADLGFRRAVSNTSTKSCGASAIKATGSHAWIVPMSAVDGLVGEYSDGTLPIVPRDVVNHSVANTVATSAPTNLHHGALKADVPPHVELERELEQLETSPRAKDKESITRKSSRVESLASLLEGISSGPTTSMRRRHRRRRPSIGVPGAATLGRAMNAGRAERKATAALAVMAGLEKTGHSKHDLLSSGPETKRSVHDRFRAARLKLRIATRMRLVETKTIPEADEPKTPTTDLMDSSTVGITMRSILTHAETPTSSRKMLGDSVRPSVGAVNDGALQDDDTKDDTAVDEEGNEEDDESEVEGENETVRTMIAKKVLLLPQDRVSKLLRDEASSVHIPILYPANVLGFVKTRHIITDFALSFTMRIQAYTLMFGLYALLLVGYLLTTAVWSVDFNDSAAVGFIVFSELAFLVAVLAQLVLAALINFNNIKHRAKLNNIEFMAREYRRAPGLPRSALQRIAVLLQTLRFANTALENDLLHRPARVMGVRATFGLAGTFASVAASGVIAAYSLRSNNSV